MGMAWANGHGHRSARAHTLSHTARARGSRAASAQRCAETRARPAARAAAAPAPPRLFDPLS